jgi:hypothetical protein
MLTACRLNRHVLALLCCAAASATMSACQAPPEVVDRASPSRAPDQRVTLRLDPQQAVVYSSSTGRAFSASVYNPGPMAVMVARRVAGADVEQVRVNGEQTTLVNCAPGEAVTFSNTSIGYANVRLAVWGEGAVGMRYETETARPEASEPLVR